MWLKQNWLYLFIFGLGLLFALAVPPFQKPDENRHYYQASALSRGVVNCRSDESGNVFLPLPKSVSVFPSLLKVDEIAHTPNYKFTPGMFALYPYPQDDVEVREYSWCSYSPVGYLPNTVGLLLGRLTGSRLLEFYLSRLFGLIVFMFGLGWALRVGGQAARPWLYLFALTPMTLHQATSISYDTLQLALLPLIFAYSLKFTVGETKPTAKSVAIFLSALFLFVLSKPAYLPFLFLSLLLRKPKIYLPFLLGSFALLLPFTRPSHYLGLSGDVDPALQLQMIISDPLHLIKAIWTTLSGDTQALYEGLVGNFGWLDYKLHYLFYLLWFAVFTGIALRGSQKNLRPFPLLLFSALILAVFLLVFTSLYLIWTPVGTYYVTGVQGRYFLVIIPFVGLVVSSVIQLLVKHRRARHIFFSLIAGIFFVHLLAIIYFRYYDYSQAGVNDQELLSSIGPQLKLSEPQDFTVPLPSRQQKLTGFYYLPAAAEGGTATYQYQIKDSDCQKILRSGYLQSVYGLKPGKLSEEKFTPFWVAGPAFCLNLIPVTGSAGTLTLSQFNGAYIKPLYLITSLRDQ